MLLSPYVMPIVLSALVKLPLKLGKLVVKRVFSRRIENAGTRVMTSDPLKSIDGNVGSISEFAEFIGIMSSPKVRMFERYLAAIATD